MEIFGWVIWAVSCIAVIFSLMPLFVELFKLGPPPEGAERHISPQVFMLISGFISLAMAAGVIVTAFTNISKFNLLWFIPLSFWGIPLFFWKIGVGAWYSEYSKQTRSCVNQPEPSEPKAAQKALKKRGFPRKFVKGLRKILGDDKFTSLTLLGEKYYLFDQDFFSKPHSFKDINHEMTKLRVTAFLLHMANELCRRQIFDAGEELAKIVLTLDPKFFTAYATLALICRDTSRFEEARKYASQAIAGMNSFDQLYKDAPTPPEYICDPQHIADLRDELNSISTQSANERKSAEKRISEEQEKVIDGVTNLLMTSGVNKAAFYLADLLAEDPSFMKEISLDEYPREQAVLGLGVVFGFILAMYDACVKSGRGREHLINCCNC